MLDEIDDPNLHQWLCICRLLMFHHPTTGADCAEWFDKGAPAPPGWNRRRSPLKDHDTFTLIDTASGSGETRFTQPANTGIHDARPYASLAETEIWKIARRLAEVFNESPTLEGIERSAFAGRAALRAAIGAYTTSLTAQLGKRGNAWFRWAPRAVVDAYLRFEVPGAVAAVCLASVLHATVDFLCQQVGQARSVPLIRGAYVSHLGDLAYRLIRRRRSCNVSGYYQLSYLASLYSMAAVALADGLAEQLDPNRRDALNHLLLNIEEKACDLLNSNLFVFPARFSTVGILKYMVGYCSLSGKSLEEAVTEHNLHPALAVAFSAEASAFSVADHRGEGGSVEVSLAPGANLEDVQRRVHNRYIAESRRLDSVDLPALLHGEFNPIHERISALLAPIMNPKKIRRVVQSWQWP
jgi:hypothetical protein